MSDLNIPEQLALRCTIMRGGTSKGLYLMEQDVPTVGPARDRLLKRIMGTPDIIQIDGLGGSRMITSKIAIIKRSARPDADVDYTFAQVSLDQDLVCYEGNCGNISSGVGPFAIDAGLVDVTEPVTTVRIHNTNTGRLLVAHVPVAGGRAKVRGDFAIDGVPGTGAEIRMDYLDTVGAKTGRILPTGNVIDELAFEDGGRLSVTLCDVANPCVFLHAADVGLEGGELPEDFSGNPTLLARLREIRGKAAALLGFTSDWREVDKQSPALPLMVIVAEPQDYRTIRHKVTFAADIDLRARMIWYNGLHESMAGTGSMCTAAASRISGSVTNRVLPAGVEQSGSLRIGHPLGVMQVNVAAEKSNRLGGVSFTTLGFSRTARRIMDGTVYVPRKDLELREAA